MQGCISAYTSTLYTTLHACYMIKYLHDYCLFMHICNPAWASCKYMLSTEYRYACTLSLSLSLSLSLYIYIYIYIYRWSTGPSKMIITYACRYANLHGHVLYRKAICRTIICACRYATPHA